MDDGGSMALHDSRNRFLNWIDNTFADLDANKDVPFAKPSQSSVEGSKKTFRCGPGCGVLCLAAVMCACVQAQVLRGSRWAEGGCRKAETACVCGRSHTHAQRQLVKLTTQ